MTHTSRLHPRVAGALATVLLLGLAACGGSSSDHTADILPDGADDPRAYSEEFLSRHPGALLRPSHLAILTLEPTQGAQDTGSAAGVDVVAYHFDRATELDLSLDASADRVGSLVLRDARGRELASVRSGTVHVRVARGRYALEIHHGAAGDPSAPTQVVFVQPATATGATLQASGNCVGCNFDQASLMNQTFDGLDLSSASFNFADVESCSFVGANLNGTSWTAATLRNDAFTDAAMQQAQLYSDVAVQTSIFSCDFRGADLSGAYLDNVDLFNATFGDPDPSRAANLSGTSWRTLDDPCFFPQLALVDFRNVNLTGARFLGPAMSGVDFSGATMTGVNLTGGPGTCDVVGNRPVITTCDAQCVFGTEPTSGRKTDLSNAILAAPGAPSVQLQGQTLAGIVLAGAQLTGGAFDDYDVSGSDLTGADLTGTQLNGANLQGVTLTGATLAGVQLNGANLDGVDLHGQMMIGAQLNGASLFEGNLQGATLDNSQLVGARLNLSNLKDASLRGVVAGVQPGSGAQGTQLGGAYMVNVDLTNADLRSADLSGAHLYGNSLLVGTLLDSADLSGAICAGAAFSGSLDDTVFNQAVLVNATFNGANLTDAKFDTAYLQGANFASSTSVLGVTLRNAAVSTMPGTWTFTEQDGTPFTYAYEATQLGALATDSSVICPNDANGPCTSDTLTPVANGPFPPVPPCVPSRQFCYQNCLDPPDFTQHPPCG
jgi:uncharacterized protein YjbI with pentapeptide repeats